ncbi:hypothetical protein AB0D66_29465 [Streptomyces sp. NPDC048270]|uniref:hypothetical protein n=1 Tax=Streptomyces sp. NPDC048270 TaxID=3154615 RepID=UPI0034088D21
MEDFAAEVRNLAFTFHEAYRCMAMDLNSSDLTSSDTVALFAWQLTNYGGWLESDIKHYVYLYDDLDNFSSILHEESSRLDPAEVHVSEDLTSHFNHMAENGLMRHLQPRFKFPSHQAPPAPPAVNYSQLPPPPEPSPFALHQPSASANGSEVAMNGARHQESSQHVSKHMEKRIRFEGSKSQVRPLAPPEKTKTIRKTLNAQKKIRRSQVTGKEPITHSDSPLSKADEIGAAISFDTVAPPLDLSVSQLQKGPNSASAAVRTYAVKVFVSMGADFPRTKAKWINGWDVLPADIAQQFTTWTSETEQSYLLRIQNGGLFNRTGRIDLPSYTVEGRECTGEEYSLQLNSTLKLPARLDGFDWAHEAGIVVSDLNKRNARHITSAARESSTVEFTWWKSIHSEAVVVDTASLGPVADVIKFVSPEEPISGTIRFKTSWRRPAAVITPTAGNVSEPDLLKQMRSILGGRRLTIG